MIGQTPSTVTSGPTDPFPHPEACPTVTGWHQELRWGRQAPLCSRGSYWAAIRENVVHAGVFTCATSPSGA